MSRVVQPPPGDRLDSWKEIAAYLNRGVRTVRRWEELEGLPIHRQLHRTQGTVYAFKSEIDAWRQNAARAPVPPAAAGGAAAATPGTSIAVLPFANLSTDPDNAYFADGLTDEVTADLSRVRALRVISRTSSVTYRNTAKDVRTIAAELGVRYVLEGSVRRVGSRLRITAQLIDASTDAHLWAGKYDGIVDQVFDFQERLARVIVGALELRLSTDEERRLAERPIANLQAYEGYLRARQEMWRWRGDAIDRAVHLLDEALTMGGESAGLYATLGLAHLQYREAGIDLGPRPLQEADACAQKVFALGPGSAAGLQLRGWIDYSRGRVQEAVRALSEALAIEPNNADTLGLLSNCYLISGKVAAARPLIARLLAVDPLTPLNRCLPGFADIMDGQFAPALEPYRQMFEMDPGNPMARLFYVWVLVLNQQTERAGATVDGFGAEARKTIPGRVASILADAAAGDAAAVKAALSPELDGLANGADLFPRMLAQGCALAGLADPALDWLEIAIRRGFVNYPFLARYDPFFASLRTHPRFLQLAETARDRWERFES